MSDTDWDNFVRGINRVALETERLPALRDPELERPGSVEDKRMRHQHEQRVASFYEQVRRPVRLTFAEAARIKRLSDERAASNERAAQYRAYRNRINERKTA